MFASKCGPPLAGLLLLGAGAAAWPALAQPLPAPAPAPPLTLADALARAARVDPGLAGASARQAAAEAAVRQADLRPNPTLGLEVENLAGTGGYSILDRPETTLSYGRTLERGRKREARVGEARAGVAVARLRAEVQRLDYLRDAQAAYAEALAAEAELLVAEARLIAAQQAQADVARRVKSARDPLFAGSRAEALTAQAEIARDRAREAAKTARTLAAGYWGGGDFAVPLDAFFNVAPPAELPAASPPDLALMEAERDAAAASVRLARAQGLADPTVSGGLRHFGAGSDLALVAGVSIPLGVGRTNRANVARAEAQRSAAEADVAAARIARDREIVRLTARQRALATESERIRAEVIPHAIRAVEQVTDGFNRGGFSFADVTAAQAALAEARARRVEVLREFHQGQAALDRLTGKHRSLILTSSEERP